MLYILCPFSVPFLKVPYLKLIGLRLYIHSDEVHVEHFQRNGQKHACSYNGTLILNKEKMIFGFSSGIELKLTDTEN